MKIIPLFILSTYLVFAVETRAQIDVRNRGVSLYSQGKNREAIEVFERALKQNEFKRDAALWNYLGLAYANTSEFKNARKAFERAADLDPDSSSYRVNLGYAYLMTGLVDKAQSHLEKAIVYDPRNALAYHLRGTSYLWERKFSAALSDAETAVSLDAAHAPAYLLKAEVLTAMFGEHTAKGLPPKEKVELLQHSVEVLESGLKNPRRSADAKVLNEKLEGVREFYKYFDRVKAAPISASDAPDPDVTPLKILGKVKPSYTDNARYANISGTIKLAVLFAATGKVTHTMVLNGLGYGLDEQAVLAARKMTFEPKKEKGKPVSTVRLVTFSFEIR